MEPQAGLAVAYWPTEEQIDVGFRPADENGYIAAMIVSVPRSEPGTSVTWPTANLRLFPDLTVVTLTQIAQTVGVDCSLAGVSYSAVPARGCWSWLPRM